MTRRALQVLILGYGVLAATLGAPRLGAQDSLPPWAGGLTASLGQPSRTRFSTGAAFGLDWRRNHTLNPSGQLSFGVTRDLTSPVLGFVAASVEAYGGLRSTELDGGIRFLVQLPILRTSLGTDYNIAANRFGLSLGISMPVRRGGIFGSGSLLRLEGDAGALSAFRVGVVVPVGRPAAGHTRALRTRADVALRSADGVAPPADAPGLDSALAQVRIAARRIEQLIVPWLDRPGSEPRAALAPLVAELRAPVGLTGVTGPGLQVDGVVRAYHTELARAFSIAAAGQALPAGATTAEGELAADVARRVLRDHLLYPYDRLLGQWKTKTVAAALAAQARGNFARGIVSLTSLPPAREAALLYVFQELLSAVLDLEREATGRWEDNRVVWLPLQLGLRPEDHDTQGEIDAILQAVIGEGFTDGNRVWYIVNRQFQTEVIRSIQQAEDYHVLWIHDFSGRNEAGFPDAFSPRFVVDAYYRALIRRVRDYDRRRRLPLYLIFLDQHYYEQNNGRLWLDLLERPLGRVPTLPPGFRDFTDTIRVRQAELREAIAGSRLLQAEARQYGQEWLRNVVKVQVNVTNPADPSFWSRQILPVLGIPDNLMRDHRKIVFYDIAEEDPYRGTAMYTGMGIGEHYVAPTWEDRALMVQGPAVLSLKAQARRLLETQGLTGDRMPYPLRARPLAADYQDAVTREIRRRRDAGGRDQRAVELHNGTGFQDKEVSVAKAVLYSLMPPGSVVMAPDAIWGSAVYASLLTGSAFRGCRVLFIAPSLRAAPSSNWPTMGVAHDLFARLIVLQQAFGPELEASGGLLKTGIYNPEIGVLDVAGRFGAAYKNGRRTPFLRRLFPLDRTVDTLLSHAVDLAAVPPDSARTFAPEPISPKLHLKASFFASREGWDSLMARPEMAPLLEAYLTQLLRTDVREFDVQAAAGALAAASDRIEASYRASLPPAQQERVLYYLLIGSANEDYRSMLMDGEASVLLSGWSGIVGLIDFSLMAGLSVWIDDLEMLDALVPPPSNFQRRLARGVRFIL